MCRNPLRCQSRFRRLFLGAFGYLVEGGRIVRPVDQITIAGNFFKLLESVEAIGSDLEFEVPSVRAMWVHLP